MLVYQMLLLIIKLLIKARQTKIRLFKLKKLQFIECQFFQILSLMQKQIQTLTKHINKVTRILNRISDQNPHLSQELDLALYSCLKIDKVIKQFVYHHSQQLFFDKQGQSLSQNQDQYGKQIFNSAFSFMKNLKASTKKLEKKIDILVQQNHFLTKPYQDGISSQQKQKHTSEYIPERNKKVNRSPFSKYHKTAQSLGKPIHRSPYQGMQKSHSKSKKHNMKEYINQDQQNEYDLAQVENSKDIQQLDQQIIDLASEIKKIMKTCQ